MRSIIAKPRQPKHKRLIRKLEDKKLCLSTKVVEENGKYFFVWNKSLAKEAAKVRISLKLGG